MATTCAAPPARPAGGQRPSGEAPRRRGGLPAVLPTLTPRVDQPEHAYGEAGRHPRAARQTPGIRDLAAGALSASPRSAAAGSRAGRRSGRREFSLRGSLACLPRFDQPERPSGRAGTRSLLGPETAPTRLATTLPPPPSLTVASTVRDRKENVRRALGLAPQSARPSGPASEANRPWPALYRLAPASGNTHGRPESGRRTPPADPLTRQPNPGRLSRPVTYRRSHTMADTTAATGTPGQHGDVTLLTVEQAARRLSIGRTTMFALLKSGDILSVRIGRLRRVPIRALDAFAAQLAQQQRAA
jgi:excisionase family DNA binding protein